MTGAVALTVVLVIVVAGFSLAMQSQQTMQGGPRVARPPRTPRPPAAPKHPGRKAQPAAVDVPRPAPGAGNREPEPAPPELRRTGQEAEAKVISVVDERTIGPVTRSRLTVQIEPPEGDPFEVTTRVAFQTQDARARIKVGGTVKVHYDRDDRTRVVVDLPADSPEPPPGGTEAGGGDGPAAPPSP